MNHFSQSKTVFQDRILPEPNCELVGYGELISRYDLKVLLPEELSVIAPRNRKYSRDGWNVYTVRHMPEDSISGHLTFALKHEGVDLTVLHALFKVIDPTHIADWVRKEPTGRYSRRIWFFYEWLTSKTLDIPDATSGNFVYALDKQYYYTGSVTQSRRHRVRNNLPGVRNFCPLVRKTEKLENFLSEGLQALAHQKTKSVHPDVLARAAAFLLLKDSRASFEIEGERPGKNRAERWGSAICRAGQSSLSPNEFVRLQNIVIEDTRFVRMGFRREGGFIGVHERSSGVPIPDHISAKWEDVSTLIDALIATDECLKRSDMDPVIAAAIIAFGFVFIHPFSDGNGRIHRYLIHHVLNEREFSPKGIIFPISAVILERLDEYRKVLESYSKPRLPFIEWRPTEDGNVEVLNETIDLYRYFDATRHAEFLYDCVYQTVTKVLPEEVLFLEKYDRMKTAINERYDMPDYTSNLLIRFLEQNKGKLSNRAQEKEFKDLSIEEVAELEHLYIEIFER